MAATTYDDVLARTIALIARVCNRQAAEESRFVDDLELDSIDLVGLISEMEEEFKIFVPEARLHTFRTVSDAAHCVHELLTATEQVA